MLTEVRPDKSGTLEKEVLESEEPNPSPDILSPMGSFPFLSSEQNSEGKEENPIFPATNRVKTL